MAMIDPFTPDAFKLETLTAAINQLEYRPSVMSALFEEQGIATLNATIEEQSGLLLLVDTSQRGSTGIQLGRIPDSRKLRSFKIPHLQQNSSLLADEVQGARAFGTESTAEVLNTRLTEKLDAMRRNLDYTIESHRFAAVMGNYIDTNGDNVSLFTTFNVTQQSLSFALATATTKIRSKCNTVWEYVENALGGAGFSGIRVLCGKTFWDNLITHANVESTYLNTQMAADLRRDTRLAFNFGGLDFERVRGTTAVKIPDNEAYAIPEGVSGLFMTRFAPADYTETVNTLGLPYYAKSEPLPLGKGYLLEAQTNPINLCTRPAAVIKLTVS